MADQEKYEDINYEPPPAAIGAQPAGPQPAGAPPRYAETAAGYAVAYQEQQYGSGPPQPIPAAVVACPVISQPQPIIQQAPPTIVITRAAESDCLVWSILNCLFCNCILGIIAIVFSALARESFDRGNVADGKSKRAVAKALNIVSLVLGLTGAVAAVATIISFSVSSSRVLSSSRHLLKPDSYSVSTPPRFYTTCYDIATAQDFGPMYDADYSYSYYGYSTIYQTYSYGC